VKAQGRDPEDLARVSDRTIKNVPIKYVALEYKDAAALAERVRSQGERLLHRARQRGGPFRCS
jgi:hypothetical protein